MKTFAQLAALGAALVSLLVVPQLAEATARDAEIKAKKAAFELLQSGYTNRARFHAGYMKAGDRKMIRTVFHSGNEYKVVANGDEDATNIDVEIYDEDWKLVGRDEDEAGVAVASAAPKWTGQFYVIVTLKSAQGNAAYTNTVIVYR